MILSVNSEVFSNLKIDQLFRKIITGQLVGAVQIFYGPAELRSWWKAVLSIEHDSKKGRPPVAPVSGRPPIKGKFKRFGPSFRRTLHVAILPHPPPMGPKYGNLSPSFRSTLHVAILPHPPPMGPKYGNVSPPCYAITPPPSR